MTTKDYTQRNFTIKSVALSLILAILLAAANAYLALKISTTISASIPAAVLSIGVFRLFKHYSVYECNLVQTAASAGEGMAAAAAFILPAMIIFHFWDSFHYWTVTLIVGIGGVLGVFLAVPLRRVLLGLQELKYPEGTAIGNVLKVSANRSEGLLKYLLSGIAGGSMVSFLQQGLQVVGSVLPLWVKTRGLLVGVSLGFSPATFAAGFIIGPEVAVSLFIGLVIGWVILIPVFSHMYGIPDAVDNYTAVMTLAAHHLKYVGVGTMIFGGIWSLIKLVKPLGYSVKISLKLFNKKEVVSERDRDIPILMMGLGVLIFSGFLLCFLAHSFNAAGMNLSFNATVVALVVTLFFIMILGFILTTVTGYMTGIVGSTNSPISSMIIVSVLLIGLIYTGIFDIQGVTETTGVVSLIIIVAGIVGCVTAVGSENFQDLKAGQMIGATPWKQQLMLALGVIAASLVLAPVLNLLYHAYGMGGVAPHPGMDPGQMLSAPQATLVGTLAMGVVTHQVDWSPIFAGALIGAMTVLADLIICKRYFTFRISPLGVGLAIYLPSDLMVVMILGGAVSLFIKHIAKKRLPNDVEAQSKVSEMANLTACGIVAGSALMGVFLAIPFAISGNPGILTPAFAYQPYFVWIASILGFISIAYLMKMLLNHLPKKDS